MNCWSTLINLIFSVSPSVLNLLKPTNEIKAGYSALMVSYISNNTSLNDREFNLSKIHFVIKK